VTGDNTQSAYDAVLDEPVPWMAMVLRISVLLAVALAVAGAVMDGDFGRFSAGACVVVIVALPLLRVVVQGLHWARIRDLRFALAAAGLLAVVATGAIIASL